MTIFVPGNYSFVLDNEAQNISVEPIETNNENDDDESQRENPLFVRVNLDKEDNDKEGTNKEDLLEEDPIASDTFITENTEGADEELCIIPDTERVISQVKRKLKMYTFNTAFVYN